jgi:hypothetical protein
MEIAVKYLGIRPPVPRKADGGVPSRAAGVLPPDQAALAELATTVGANSPGGFLP